MNRPDDPEPPRLQDTTERDALPLPVAGGEPAPADEPAPPEVVAAEAGPEPAGVEPASEPEEQPADKSAAVEEPAPASSEPAPPPPPPADKSASVDAPGGSNGSAAGESPFPPPYGPDTSQGPRPEVLVGAAFAGGLLLALILRRLGR